MDLALIIISLAAAGALAGLLAGMFGVGGGAIMVPILYQLFVVLDVPADIRMHLAAGTSLAVIIPTSLRSFFGHRAKGAVDMDVLRGWAIPVVLGVIGGTLIAAHVSSSVLRAVFAVVCALNALKLFIGRDEWRISDHLPAPFAMKLYGILIGILSTLMGVGGGIFGNMILTLYGKSLKAAAATSSGLGVLISIPAMLGFMMAGWPDMARLPDYSLGYVSLISAALIAPTSVLAAPMGVKLAHKVSKRTQEVAFAVFLSAIAIRFSISIWS